MNDTTNQPAADTAKTNGHSARMRRGGLYKRPGSPIYYARWTINGKVFKVSTGKTNEREAESRLADLMKPYVLEDEKALAQSVAAHIAGTEAEIQKIEDEKAEELRIADAWIAFTKSKNRPDTGAATLHMYELQFAAFEDWASKRTPPVTLMREVDKDIASDFVGYLDASRFTNNTINKYAQLLQLVWRVLQQKDHRITLNPWTKDNITRKKIKKTEQGRRELTLAELKTICNAAMGELATLLALGLFTGMRLGDCCTLRWGETDLDRSEIKKVLRKSGTEVQIPIHMELLKVLRVAEESKDGPYVLPEISAAYLKRNQTVVARIQKHFADCGIVTAAPERKQRARRGVEVGFHSLRHSFVSLCARSGVPMAAVQELVGHSSPAMTKHYTHMGLSAMQGAIAALPSLSDDAEDAAKAKPSPTPADALKTILGLAKGMTAKNWTARKTKIIEAVDAVMGAANI